MGKRRVTSSDVARHAGVSRTTVSFVLNNVTKANISDETRQRVLQAAAELNYVPNAAAQALAGLRTQLIGLVFPRVDSHLTSHFFLLQVMDGLLDVAQKHGVRVLIDTLEDGVDEQSYLSMVRAKRIDGMIAIDPRKDEAALRTLAKSGFPVVVIGRLPDSDICSVDVDNRLAARMVTEHLLSLGHRRIACITNAPATGYTVAQERVLGYQDALRAAAIALDDSLIFFGKHTPESGEQAMAQLLANAAPLPSAVFVASDVVAIGALGTLHQAGLRVPEDMSVAGFDDVPIARFFNPSLTTIRIPAQALGSYAGELLIERIRDDSEPGRRLILDTELIVRASSAALHHK